MSAKLSRTGEETFVARNHIALERIVLQERRDSNRWADGFGMGRKPGGWMAPAQWTRLRLPCRRAEWWQ